MSISGSQWRLWGGLLALLLFIVGVGSWYMFSARAALDEMTAARKGLTSAREAIEDSDPVQAKTLITAASQSATAAANRVNGPMWDLAAHVPVLGATPRATRTIATSLDQTLKAVQPLNSQLDILDPTTLVTDDGRIDISRLVEAVPAMQKALPGIAEARSTMDDFPDSGLIVPPLNSVGSQFSEQLDSLQSILSAASTFGEVAEPLLGKDGQKRYFLGILNPNEARGTGGFLGTYAILTADNGKLSVSEVGSNTDLPNLDGLPDGLSRGFQERYSDDPILRGNMNLSPHFPDTARIWLAAWEKKTGEKLDGALAADVIALGDIAQASGRPVPLPDGGSIRGDQLGQFAIQGIYQKFPDGSQVAERKAYQEAITSGAVTALTESRDPQAMAKALGKGLSDRRIVAWSADPEVEKQLVEAGVAGSLAVPDGHQVQFVALNGSGSKLDAFLSRSLIYEVGRCEGDDGRVESKVSVTLKNDIGFGQRPPAYMVGQAEEDATGPVNLILAQFHLPNGAELVGVTRDGEQVGYAEFTEQGRPSLVLSARLPPREDQELVVTFREPLSSGSGVVTVQPLASRQATQTSEARCA